MVDRLMFSGLLISNVINSPVWIFGVLSQGSPLIYAYRTRGSWIGMNGSNESMNIIGRICFVYLNNSKVPSSFRISICVSLRSISSYEILLGKNGKICSTEYLALVMGFVKI